MLSLPILSPHHPTPSSTPTPPPPAAHHWSDDLTSARRALTAGLFPHAARLQPDGTYRVLATRALVSLHPSSVLCQRKPEFVVFNEVRWDAMECV